MMVRANCKAQKSMKNTFRMKMRSKEGRATQIRLTFNSKSSSRMRKSISFSSSKMIRKAT